MFEVSMTFLNTLKGGKDNGIAQGHSTSDIYTGSGFTSGPSLYPMDACCAAKPEANKISFGGGWNFETEALNVRLDTYDFETQQWTAETDAPFA